MRYFVLSILCLTFAGCGLDQTLDRSDKPLSREEASKHISVPFPASARDVYFVFHSGGMQELQFFVRFTVDPRDLDDAVRDIISDHDKRAQEHYSYPQLTLSEAPHPPIFPDLLPMPWWHADSIANGYYRGTTNGQPFYLWIDTGQHTIYLCMHD